MSFDPDIIDAMVAAGMSAPMIAAVYRAYCAKRRDRPAAKIGLSVTRNAPSVTPTVTPVTRNAVTPAAPKSLGAIRQKRWRDSKKQPRVTPTVTPVTRNAPLSLSLKEDSNSLEREGSVTRNVPTVTRNAVTLPAGWQPNDEGAQLVAALGDIGAANCIANFRDHFEASGKLMTAAQWQARFRVWVRNERGRASSGQSPLPLMRSLDAPHGPPSEFVTIRQGTPEAAALEAQRGKPIPWGKSGTWAVKATEWPPQAPTSAEQRRESG
jgi:hypothetical protein